MLQFQKATAPVADEPRLVASLVASEDADFIRELRDGLGEALGISKTPRGTRGGKKVQARRAAQKHAEAHAMFGKVGQ